MFGLISRRPDIDKIDLYAEDPFEAKYQFKTNKREITGLKNLNDFKAFIEYSNDMYDIYKNIEEYNPNEKRKILIVFDDGIYDILSNKKLSPIVTALFIRGRELNISPVFITLSYFTVPKNIRLNSADCYIMKIRNTRVFQQIAFNHSSDIDFRYFMSLYKKCSAKPYSFLVIDSTLAPDTCAEIATEMKKYFRLNDMLNLNVL